MYFRTQKRNILNVSDYYANLDYVDESGNLVFTFYYSMSPQFAVLNNATTVNVSVISKVVTKKSILDGSQAGNVDSARVVKNILLDVQSAKSAAKEQSKFVVASKKSDVTAWINNEALAQLKAGIAPENIPQMQKTVLKSIPVSQIKDDSENKPVTTVIAHSSVSTSITEMSSSTYDQTTIMQKLINERGIDPSLVTSTTHRSLTSLDSKDGTLRRRKIEEYDADLLSQLTNGYLFSQVSQLPSTTNDVTDDTVVQVAVTETQKYVEVPVTVTINKSALTLEGSENYDMYVKFDLINTSTGLPVDSVTKSLNVAKHLLAKNIPTKSPVVKASPAFAYTNLEIKQVDENATSVNLYKKSIYAASSEIDQYSFVGSYALTPGSSITVQVDSPHASSVIYRVIPVGQQGTLGLEYTNVIVRPKKVTHVKSANLTTQQIPEGVRLTVRNLPHNVAAVQFIRKNKSTYESDYSNVESPVLIDGATRSENLVFVVDQDVKPNNTYEYSAKIIYRFGTSEQTNAALVEFIEPSPGKVDTKLSDLVVEQQGDVNVRFKISTTIVDTNIDIIRNALKQQDTYELFRNDVEREREMIKSLIAHNVQRVNLTSGEREDFGVVTTTDFSDRELRNNQSIKPLKIGHRYRYEIYPLVRSVETMFEKLEKQSVDQVTKKPYSFKPNKFLHPVTLTDGTIMSSTGLRAHYAKEAMSHGIIGSVQAIEVSLDLEQARIVDQAVSRFDIDTNVITWSIQGDVSSIDHFILMKNVSGVRTFVGKVHAEFQYGTCQFFHNLTKRDEGSYSYIIVPVFNDYKVGQQVTTNTVLV